ncbi:uncharacterized protein LOC108216961 [Daucus carota subsp. sativus]|uniref:uncharacterized protein LOC108216961 n=1 Tax=Daucus carota subsp. sativus TaxID=79200 RepID=UPI0007EFCA75|nr:PREDICTED: uncharacterized protein LOC108216961 [Daucus carota subsp. sativus]
MEVYVDDMLVKYKEAKDHIMHLSEMFGILREYRMKLNPQKCVFGVESGKFLGFMVNHHGIEANPAKIEALINMKSPRAVKEVQSLTGRIAALNRFVSKSSDRCQEFFKAIKQVGKAFHWNPECEEAFQSIKRHLGSPPLLSKPKEGETLIIYLAVSDYAVNAVLVREEESTQLPVYYVSKRMVDEETRYTNMEKLAYALVLASRKLRPYFQAHKLSCGHLSPSDKFFICLKLRAVSSNGLLNLNEGDTLALIPVSTPNGAAFTRENEALWWTLHVDGASNKQGAGAGVVLKSPEGHLLKSAVHFSFGATNNMAEYEALIAGLRLAREMKVENLDIYSDSMIVVEQVKGGFQWNGIQTDAYIQLCRRLMGCFKEVHLERIPREFNANGDALEKLATQKGAVLLGVIPLETLKRPSVPEIEETGAAVIMAIGDDGDTLMTPILQFLKEGTLPEDKNEARCLKCRAACYVIYDNALYRRGFNSPLLECIDGEECNYIMREIHERICGNHSGGGSLAQKIVHQGYYWPTIRQDAQDFARNCNKFQRYANYSNLPAVRLTSLSSPWPFAMWGIDLIGELPKAKGVLNILWWRLIISPSGQKLSL